MGDPVTRVEVEPEGILSYKECGRTLMLEWRCLLIMHGQGSKAGIQICLRCDPKQV